MTNDLLKEVIADAKQVRETAYKNAMATINETFQPTIQKMITQKLAEDDADTTGDDAATAKDVKENKYMEDGKDGTPASNLKEMEDDDAKDDEKVEEAADKGTDDLNLEAVIAELEDEVKADDTAVTESEDDTMTDKELEEIVSEIENANDEKEDVKEGELPPALKKAIDAKKGDKKDDSDDEKNEAVKTLEAENAGLKEDLKEAYKAIQEQRAAIQEVNLLNAKLMYSTKLIKNFDLNEAQKVKVLEAFDRTGTVKDAKLVYATIAETLQNAGAKQKTRLAETASQTINAVKPESKNIVSERMLKIAGII